MIKEETKDNGLEDQITEESQKPIEEPNCALVNMDSMKCSTYLAKSYCPASCEYFYNY